MRMEEFRLLSIISGCNDTFEVMKDAFSRTIVDLKSKHYDCKHSKMQILNHGNYATSYRNLEFPQLCVLQFEISTKKAKILERREVKVECCLFPT